VVAVWLPDVPVIVRLYCPTADDVLAVIVNVLLEAVGFGENAAVTPLGRPDMVRFTLPVNP
jgi:hypothetical protein